MIAKNEADAFRRLCKFCRRRHLSCSFVWCERSKTYEITVCSRIFSVSKSFAKIGDALIAVDEIIKQIESRND